MKPVIYQVAQRFKDAIREAAGVDSDPLVTLAQHERWGDYQSNAAMGLAKLLAERTGTKANPRQLAQQIIDKLKIDDLAVETSIAGPGFINVRLKPEWVSEQLTAVLGDERLGVETSATPQKTIVDYSGPNIAKQMHVGHLRSTIIGDCISRVLEFTGNEVIRQNHIGDWGTQFGMLVAFLRSSGVSADSHISDLEEFYRAAKKRFDEDEEFQNEARQTVVKLQGGDPEVVALWRKIVDETRLHYQPLYEQLGVLLRPEHERGESFYNSFLSEVVATLREKGVAAESEGAIAIFVEGYEAPLIIEKKGGGYLYGTTDLAAIRYRTQTLGARRVIYTHDSRQSQHFAQVFDSARRAGFAEGVSLEFAPFGTMLGEDGRPFKTRSGDTVKLKDLLNEAEERAYQLVSQKTPWLAEEQRRSIAHSVGIGGVKYADLSKDRVSDYVFSWDKMLSMDGNTAPYLQYAYARVQAVFRKAGELPSVTTAVTVESPFEVALGKHLLRLGEVVEMVARELKPHHLSAYLFELATRFSAFYENCPILQSPEPQRSSRLALASLTARTLALGLELLGIEHPDQL